MQVIKLKKRTANGMELITLVVTMYCLLSGIRINKTELQVLSYLIRYGVKKSTKDMIVRSQILSPGSLENTFTRLRKLGLMVYDKDGLPMITSKLNFQPENKMGMIVQLENL